MIETFVLFVCWPLAVCATLLVIARIIGALNYSDIDKTLDAMKGQVISFPIMKPSILALISWGALYTLYFGK